LFIGEKNKYGFGNVPTSPDDVAEAIANPATAPPTTIAFGSTPLGKITVVHG
jgi:hypothetical protein